MHPVQKMPLRLQKYINLKPKKNHRHPKMKVLFLNHDRKQCGVYQYGKRVYDIIKASNIYEYHEVTSQVDYQNLVEQSHYTAIIYNYHGATMPWLNRTNICKTQPNIGILHESYVDCFDKIIEIDPNAQETSTVRTIPRPLFENLSLTNECMSPTFHTFVSSHQTESRPIFGSFGFGFSNKGFPTIVKMINEQYEDAIIKFLIPTADFDADPSMRERVLQACFQEKTKPNIILMIYTDFVNENDLLIFLRSNTMNMFLYDKLHGRGISSTIDYALSVRRPLGISDSDMFRHIYHDNICVYKNNIQTCMQNSLLHCEKFCQLYSHDNMRNKFLQILSS